MRSALREPMADERLMSAFRRGDVAAAEELFLRFAPRIFTIGLRRFHDVDLASAFVGQAFVRMWQLASRFSLSSGPLDAWFVRQACDLPVRTHVTSSAGAPRRIDRT